MAVSWESPRSAWLVAFGLACVATLPFVRIVPAYFVSNDIAYVHHYLHLEQPWQTFVWGAVAGGRDTLTSFYRPIPFVVTWVATRLWGASPEPFHVVSLILHGFNCGLTFLLAWRLLGRTRAALAGSVVAAGLVAVHPRRVEAVAWISCWPDLMCTFFGLLCVLLFVGPTGAIRNQGRVHWYVAASVMAWWGALLSKEGALLLPLALAVLPGASGAHEERDPVTRVLRLWPFGVSVAAYVALRRVALGTWLGGYEQGAYLADLSNAYSWPLRHLAYNLVPPLDLVSGWSVPLYMILGSVVLVAPIGVAWVAWNWRHVAAMRFAVAWTGAAILPVMMFRVYLGWTFGDRYLYLPGIGLAIGAAALITVGRHLRWSVVATVLGVIFALHTAVLTERWRVAGQMAERLCREIAATIASVDTTTPAYLVSVPDSYRGALMLRERIPEAVEMLGGRNSRRIVPLSAYLVDRVAEAPVYAFWDRDEVVVRSVGTADVFLPAHLRTDKAEAWHRLGVVQSSNLEPGFWYDEIRFRLKVPGEAWLVTPTGLQAVPRIDSPPRDAGH